MSARWMAAAAMLLVPVACSESLPAGPAEGAASPGVPAAAVLVATSFSGTDLPVALVDPGSMSATSQQYLMRGVRLRFRLDATDPRMTGFGTVVANGNLSVEDGSGQVWGELVIDSDAGDHWSGSWHGRRQPDGSVWRGDLDMTLRGTGASNERLLVQAHEVITTFSLVPTVYIGQVEGTIVNPGGVQ